MAVLLSNAVPYIGGLENHSTSSVREERGRRREKKTGMERKNGEIQKL